MTPLAMGGPEIIVESFSDGQNAAGFKAVEGNWMDSAGKSGAPGVRATKSKFKTAGGKAGAARFTPEIATPGKYQVFVTYPSSGNAMGVIYKIHHAGGDQEVVQNQSGRDAKSPHRANVWNSLGTFEFKQGNEGYVEVRDPGTGTAASGKEGARIYADAVMLLPDGAAPPAGSGAAPAANAVKSSASDAPKGPATPASAAALASEPSAAPTLAPAAGTSSGQPSLANALPFAGGASGAASASTPAALPTLGGASAATPAGSGSSLPSLGGSASAPVPAATPLSQYPGLGSSTASAGTGASLPSLTGAAASATPSAGSSLPSLPSLESSASPAASTPQAMPSLASAASAPAAASSLPTLDSALGSTPASQPSAQPSLGSATGALPPLTPGASSASTPAVPDAVASLPPAPGRATQNPFGASAAKPAGSSDATASDLPWFRDFGSAVATAKNTNKKVFVFFEAQGNRQVARYDREIFSSPAVKAALLESYVLLRVDFPQNTKLGYQMDVFGAGIIAVTDMNGIKKATIPEAPATPEDLIKKLQGIK